MMPTDFAATPEQMEAFASAANPSDPMWNYDPNNGWESGFDSGWDMQAPVDTSWDYNDYQPDDDYGVSYDDYY